MLVTLTRVGFPRGIADAVAGTAYFLLFFEFFYEKVDILYNCVEFVENCCNSTKFVEFFCAVTKIVQFKQNHLAKLVENYLTCRQKTS